MVGRGTSAKKLNALLLCCLSETASLLEMHQERLLKAETDVVHLLRTGQSQRVLLWVERVIKERNIVDVLFMVLRIIRILIENIPKIKTRKCCPVELREAVASLVYAAPRCGECPGLLRLANLLISKFMKHCFDCSSEANQKMVQMLSTAQSSWMTRLEIMKEIADVNAIALNLNRISLSELD
ncbi:hypothetical protein Cni_G03548 [Canna indica]|uniref:Uncharacterized protein n=1 Tax=Canna indica TaxID=4628 RepID=A0AAQ3JSM7_9LILI|nr:hypothetical protein Cni_G03548 [Canna indica]